MEDDLITIEQASERLGIALSTLRLYISRKELIPACRQRGKHGNPYLFRISDVDSIVNSPKWKGPRRKSTIDSHEEFQRVKKIVPDHDEEYNGCIIHWTERFRSNDTTFLYVTCARCKTKFLKRESGMITAIRRNEFTGCCSKCYSKARKKQALTLDGTTVRPGGYINRHISTFTEEEQKILRQMPLNNGIYIPEHRANMALKLGRPLETYESVHHIDGNKSNNNPDNLQIYTWHDHSKLHTDQIAEMLDARKRIEQLEIENQELKLELQRLMSMR